MKGIMRARKALCVAENPAVAKAAAYYLNFKDKGDNPPRTVSRVVALIIFPLS